MDIIWFVLLNILWLTFFDGGIARLLISVVLPYCEVREGNEVNWGFEVFCFVAVPLAWIFAMVEIYILYIRPN